jgi:hypothetical protein
MTLAALGALVALFLLTPLASVPEAQTTAKPGAGKWTMPRTSWGHPDLQGLYSNSTVVPLERPAEYKDKPELTDAEVEGRVKKYRDQLWGKREGDTGFYNEFWWEWGKDVRRTSLIVDPPDGKLPWTPGALAANKAFMTQSLKQETYEEFNIFDRCISRGLPGAMMPGFYNHFYEIMQTPDYVVLLIEMVHDVRAIALNSKKPPLPPNVKSYLGDSRGRWEGDTLVVETTNVNDAVTTSGATYFGVGSDLKLVERFTRASEDMIDYRFTVHSPSKFTRPWTAAIPLWKSNERMFEYACHEGNHAMQNSLKGQRFMEKEGLLKKP